MRSIDAELRKCTPNEEPEPAIDTGDVVHHYPTGEDWIVAYVKGDRLAACGWPQTEAALKDCHLVRKCVPETRDELLQNMAAIVGNDPRAVYARDRLRCNAVAQRAAKPSDGATCSAAFDGDRK